MYLECNDLSLCFTQFFFLLDLIFTTGLYVGGGSGHVIAIIGRLASSSLASQNFIASHRIASHRIDATRFFHRSFLFSFLRSVNDDRVLHSGSVRVPP